MGEKIVKLEKVKKIKTRKTQTAAFSFVFRAKVSHFEEFLRLNVVALVVAYGALASCG